MIYVLWFPHLINEEIETQRFSFLSKVLRRGQRKGAGVRAQPV